MGVTFLAHFLLSKGKEKKCYIERRLHVQPIPCVILKYLTQHTQMLGQVAIRREEERKEKEVKS